MKTPKHRGSALIAALIVIGVLAVVTVATLQLANISKQASAADSRRLSQTACVDAARQYVLGRLRLAQSPTTIQLDQAIQVENGQRKMRTGHISTAALPNAPVISSVMNLPGPLISNNSRKFRDVSNLGPEAAQGGGKAYRLVVACTDPQAGDMELEFTFRYGL
jgi:hypothetical protein